MVRKTRKAFSLQLNGAITEAKVQLFQLGQNRISLLNSFCPAIVAIPVCGTLFNSIEFDSVNIHRIKSELFNFSAV